MSGRYEARTVGEVDVFSFVPVVMAAQEGRPATEGITGRVLLGLQNTEGGKGGPSATLELSLDCSSETSIAEAKRQLLAAAHDLLVRLAAEPLDALEAALEREQQELLSAANS